MRKRIFMAILAPGQKTAFLGKKRRQTALLFCLESFLPLSKAFCRSSIAGGKNSGDIAEKPQIPAFYLKILGRNAMLFPRERVIP